MAQPFWKSSADPQQLALTVKGILLMVIPLVIATAKLAGVELTNEDLNAVVQVVGDIIIAVAGVVSLVMTLLGLLRKVVIAWQDRKAK